MNVSVVIPTFNRAHQIGDSIRSAQAQSHRPGEIMVVDDGSTDDTERVCTAFGSAIRYVRQMNAGVSVARNHGASLATGDAIAFLDSDDLWDPSKLALQVAALAQTNAGWSITGCNVIDMTGNVVEGRRGFTAVFGVFDSSRLAPDDFFDRYLRRTAVEVGNVTHVAYHGDAYLPLFLGNFCLPSSSVVRRTVFERVGGFDPAFRLAEETEFFHRLAEAAPVVVLMDPLVGYRVGQAGSLISPANIATLITNAIESGRRARQLRQSDVAVDRYFVLGRRALSNKLAYMHVSKGEGKVARQALRAARENGAALDARGRAIYCLSLLPDSALRALAAAKRRLRSGRR